jgi:hypothetical protein
VVRTIHPSWGESEFCSRHDACHGQPHKKAAKLFKKHHSLLINFGSLWIPPGWRSRIFLFFSLFDELRSYQLSAISF